MNRKKEKKITGSIEDYPFVEVRWFDTLADNSWMSVEKAKKLKIDLIYIYKIFRSEI